MTFGRWTGEFGPCPILSHQDFIRSWMKWAYPLANQKHPCSLAMPKGWCSCYCQWATLNLGPSALRHPRSSSGLQQIELSHLDGTHYMGWCLDKDVMGVVVVSSIAFVHARRHGNSCAPKLDKPHALIPRASSACFLPPVGVRIWAEQYPMISATISYPRYGSVLMISSHVM